MAITAAMVKELREKSGAGMMDAKKALTETDGDMEAAIDWLRTKGLATAAKKSGRTAAEGLVAVVVKDGKGVAKLPFIEGVAPGTRRSTKRGTRRIDVCLGVERVVVANSLLVQTWMATLLARQVCVRDVFHVHRIWRSWIC